MRTRIKICGITRLADALAAARLGADAIGLVFVHTSPRCVDTDTAAAIARALPPFVTRVALFVNPSRTEVESVLERVRPDMLQFHGEETAEFCRSFGVPWLKAIRVMPGVDLLQCATDFQGAAGVLFDAYSPAAHGGTGQCFDWSSIPANLPMPLVLAGGLHASNVGEAIERVRPWAVDVSSGVESAKGIKDTARMAAFIKEVIHADFNQRG